MGVLQDILKTKKAEIEKLTPKGKRNKPIFRLNDFFKENQINIIAEIKASSPSAGKIRKIDLDQILKTYSKYAKAISVLTDKTFFGGSFELLRDVADATKLPVLCKDFIIDKKQIDAAYINGADLVLLIVRVLDDEKLEELYSYAHKLGLDCLIEVHKEEELDRIKDLKPKIVGVNSRDLDNLKIDLSRTKKILSQIEFDAIRIAESGIKNKKDIDFLKQYCDGFLIGETLLKTQDINKAFEELL
ncbi:indole-3-glycerol phosphate synthase TrpC [Hippea maritima]|uniref:indole-3-glycerol-phosphate synthase n=1 Tax=Hippea maritima (strain ATCC 700847 / DSM 10411 / MH2) TaxID=760142 RepID=F2LU56_HIPMA|nr:indole-3-glycerol phosphate synthase TrpC [Hippea maritima]AEA34519.1 Indole-3-glycerol-phosphate synthase [Hippea maritima DSM 10411]